MYCMGVPRPLEQRHQRSRTMATEKSAEAHHVARPLAVDVPRPSVAIRANWGLTRLTARWGPTPCGGSGVSASCQTHCGQWHNRFCFNLGEPPTNQSAEVPGYLDPFRAHRLETDDDVYDDNRQTLSRPVQPPACQRAVQLQLQDPWGGKGKGATRLAGCMHAGMKLRLRQLKINRCLPSGLFYPWQSVSPCAQPKQSPKKLDLGIGRTNSVAAVRWTLSSSILWKQISVPGVPSTTNATLPLSTIS